MNTIPRLALPPFPASWYGVCRSVDLRVGQVLPLRIAGRELVLFRTESGAASLLDAFCPHLGAHLGHGGCVAGETVVCPFHGWRFATSGACVEVPYSGKIPPRARVAPHRVAEGGGVITAYFHPRDEAPDFELPWVDELDAADWTEPRVLRWTVRTHPQELLENAVDAAHYQHVHGMPRVPVFTEAGPIGASFRLANADLEVQVHGLGMFVVRDKTGMAGVGTGNMHATYLTPIDPERVEVLQLLTVQRLSTEAATRRMEDLWEEAVRENFARDIVIWEHKRFLPQPMLAEGDGPIGPFRRWAERFYADGRPSALG